MFFALQFSQSTQWRTVKIVVLLCWGCVAAKKCGVVVVELCCSKKNCGVVVMELHCRKNCGVVGLR